MTQEQIIKEHLENHGNISSQEAFQLYGITRLSAKIYNLRHQGLEIINELKHTVNRYGKKVTYVSYILVKASGK